MTTREKLSALRKLMKQHLIDAWIVPSADPHQSEYVAECWKTRAWLSGFTGSAGTVVVTQNRAGLWTDSRYFLQAEQELQGSGITLYKMKMPGVPSLFSWLDDEVQEGATIGFDGHVMSIAQVDELQAVLASKNIRIASQEDLCAQLWTDRPALPSTPVMVLDVQFAGEPREAKFARVREELAARGVDGQLISTLDDIAWLFNIRGNDVQYNPVTISYAYISQDEARLFIDPSKVSDGVRAALRADGVVFAPYTEVFSFLEHLPEGTCVLLDSYNTTLALRQAIPASCPAIQGSNIAFLLKAVKNETELTGIRAAHVRDGVAMVKWLSWLEQHITNEEYTEVTVVEPLEHFRSQGEFFQGLSFHPIAGYQPNGAICHYSAKPETALTIRPEGLLLVDSGAQYLDGTTDITRTFALSSPSPEQQRDFTLVLKGHIALATVKFPQGTSGSQLDTLARWALWQHGLNYGHGTGHGIGHFLNVHEGPQSIRPESAVALRPGMVCSNEPGLYRTGQYGIRIENMIIIIPAEDTEFGSFYQFETVTLCPIDLKLVEVSLLTPSEIAWLNGYHRSVYEKLAPFLDDAECEWLKEQTRQI